MKKVNKMFLYDSVCKLMDGTEELINAEHCSKISMMDGEAAENIYLLILHHFVITNKGNVKQILTDGKELPYKAKAASKDGKGLKFLVSCLSDDIQRIIVRYLRIISY